MDGDTGAKSLGPDAVTPHAFVRPGIFVTDRYGELTEQWSVERHIFPSIEQILTALDQIEMTREECGDPPWLDNR